MASKDMKIMIAADQVMYSNISKSKDGYNSARIVAKMNEKEYMSVSYEWEGSNIPDFAMSLMGFMQANELELANEKMCKKCKNPKSKCDCNDGTETEPSGGERDNPGKKVKAATKKKGKNPFVKDDEEDMDDDDKKKKDKKKKEKSGDGSQVHCKNCKKTKDKCDCGHWQPVPYKTKDQKENKTK